MSSLRIRAATPDDHPAVLEVNGAAMPGVTPIDETELRYLGSAAALFLVAELNGDVVGYLLAFSPEDDIDGEEFHWFREHVPTSLYVDQVAVHARYRRRGIGRALYDEVLAAARRGGFACLTCEINLAPPNPGSLAFHRAFGFREIGRMTVTDGRHVSLQASEIRI